MDKYNIPHDLNVFGTPVDDFPNGIVKAFHALIDQLPPEDRRVYYGISEMKGDGFIYVAATEEKNRDEAEKYGLKKYRIEKGEYLCVRVSDWQQKTESIKYVFADIFRRPNADKSKPCIEIYKDDNEMMCLVKVDRAKDLVQQLNDTLGCFMQVIRDFSGETFNKVPFEGSWTAAQVAQHVNLSISGIETVLTGNTAPTTRDPGEKVEQLKQVFLDFTIKMQSPDFIIPADKIYNKERLIESLSAKGQLIGETLSNLDVSATCLDFEFPGEGHMTRLELVSFVIVHTLRHTNQLQKIKARLS